MNKLLIPIVFFLTIMSCEKNESGNLQYSKTIVGGCFLDKGSSLKNSQITQTDTVTYSFINDSLNIFVGFNAACCGEFSNSSSIQGDSIVIKIMTIIGYVIVYAIIPFKFSGNANSISTM